MKVAVAGNKLVGAIADYVVSLVEELGHEPLAIRTDGEDDSEFPDLAFLAGTAVSQGRADRAIVFCGSGNCSAIAANKIKAVRASLCTDATFAQLSRLHFDANVLCLSGKWLDHGETRNIVEAWLRTEFSNKPRHARRIRKIHAIESGLDPRTVQ